MHHVVLLREHGKQILREIKCHQVSSVAVAKTYFTYCSCELSKLQPHIRLLCAATGQLLCYFHLRTGNLSFGAADFLPCFLPVPSCVHVVLDLN